MGLFSRKSAATAPTAAAKSEASTAVPSETPSHADLEKETEKDTAKDTGKETFPVAPHGPEKIQDVSAVQEADALDQAAGDEKDHVDENEYPSGAKLAIIVFALCISVFLVALVSRVCIGHKLARC